MKEWPPIGRFKLHFKRRFGWRLGEADQAKKRSGRKAIKPNSAPAENRPPVL